MFLKQIVDYEFWLRIGLNTSTLYIAAPLASFRVHGSATTARNNDNTALVNPAFFDSTILFHEFLYHPQYEIFRQEARNNRNQIKRLLYTDIYTILNALSFKTNEKQTVTWEVIKQRYPHIGKIARYKWRAWLYSKTPGNLRDFTAILSNGVKKIQP